MPSWSGASLLLTIGVTFVILALLVPRAKFPRQDFEYPSSDGHRIYLLLIEFLILFAPLFFFSSCFRPRETVRAFVQQLEFDMEYNKLIFTVAL